VKWGWAGLGWIVRDLLTFYLLNTLPLDGYFMSANPPRLTVEHVRTIFNIDIIE
jgi:hypothetical protein